jgi:phage baseplate assembly protein W
MSKALSLPFNFDSSSGGLDFTTDPAKMWQDRVIIAVMTNLGERVMRPTFGSDAPKTVGHNLSDAVSIISQSVTVAFSRWLTDLELIEVTGFTDSVDGYLVIQIKYKYRAQNINQTVNIKTAILSRSGDVIQEVTQNGR